MSERVSEPVDDPELQRARALRPAGWRAPGPQPRGAKGEPDLSPRPEETLSFLTGDFRIFQQRVGHRWSLDDFLTAKVALDVAARLSEAGPVASALDLGCGIGSVLLMVAWGLPDAHVVGVEAQEVSFGMAQRSLRYNGVEARGALHFGDLRETRLPERFRLITGTPPYIPVGDGVISNKVQRGPCCFETRGGIEAYCEAAAYHLADGGRFVVCEGEVSKSRVAPAARAVGLGIEEVVHAIPRVGKRALFSVYVLAASDASAAPACAEREFRVRMANGDPSPEMLGAREQMGLPPLRPPVRKGS